MTNLELQKMANEVRKDIITEVHSAKSGHPGGSLSAADVFTYLYFEEMNIDPKDPKKPDRDRFVLSKGHTAPGLYAALAERGFFPKEDLVTLRHIGSHLQGHPCMQHTPGLDMSSGLPGPGHLRSGRHGAVREGIWRQLPCIYAAGRRRASGRRGMGGVHVCQRQEAGQPLRDRGQ